VNDLPRKSSVTTYSAGGSFGCSTRARDPAFSGPSSSRVTDVTVSVHSGHRSTSVMTSQTRSGAASISTVVLRSIRPSSRSAPSIGIPAQACRRRIATAVHTLRNDDSVRRRARRVADEIAAMPAPAEVVARLATRL